MHLLELHPQRLALQQLIRTLASPLLLLCVACGAETGSEVDASGGGAATGNGSGGASTGGASTGDEAAAGASTNGEAEPTEGVPCGGGWGTAAVPGSVELGLASMPEIAGVPDGLPDERAIFEQINDERVAHGLAPLVWSDQVANVARSHAADMNQLDYFDHGSSVRAYRDEEGNTIRDNWLPLPRLQFVYPGHFARSGENIARYRNPVENVVDAWMNSSGHRAAILDDYGWTATHGAIGLDGNVAVFCPVTCR